MSLPPLTVTSTAVNVTASSTLLLAANGNRRMLALQNDSDAIMYLNLSGAAAAANTGMKVAVGGSLLFDSANGVPTAAVYGLHTSAPGNKVLLIMEGN